MRTQANLQSVSGPKFGRVVSAHALWAILARLGAIAATAAGVSHVAWGNEPIRPRSAEELNQFSTITKEAANHVPGSRVAWADYGRILRDFPGLAEDLELSHPEAGRLNEADKSKLDAWLISNFAFVGSKQAALDGVRQTPISLDKTKTTQAYRPRDWKRSAVLEARSQKAGAVMGMVDVKGFGHGAQTEDSLLNSQVSQFKEIQKDIQDASNPDQKRLDRLRTGGHSDGLMSFGEAGAEVTRQRAVQALFERKELPLETVESYAILELPFRILKDGDQTMPAALCLRQAHFGREYDTHLAPDEVFIDPRGKKQSTASGTIVDFGGVVIPHPALKTHFGHDESKLDTVGGEKVPDAQYSNPWAWAHQAADSAHRSAMRLHIEDMDAAVEKALREHAEQFEIPKPSVLSLKDRTALAQSLEKQLRSDQVSMHLLPRKFNQGWMNRPELFQSIELYLVHLLREEAPKKGDRDRWFDAAKIGLGNSNFPKFKEQIQTEYSKTSDPYERFKLLRMIAAVDQPEAFGLFLDSVRRDKPLKHHWNLLLSGAFKQLLDRGYGSAEECVQAVSLILDHDSVDLGSELALKGLIERLLKDLNLMSPLSRRELVALLNRYFLKEQSLGVSAAPMQTLARQLIDQASASQSELPSAEFSLGLVVGHPKVRTALEITARMKPWKDVLAQLQPLALLASKAASSAPKETHRQLLMDLAEISRDDASYEVLKELRDPLAFLIKKVESKSFRPTPVALKAIEDELLASFYRSDFRLLDQHRKMKKALLGIDDPKALNWMLKWAGSSLDKGFFSQLVSEKFESVANSENSVHMHFLISALEDDKTAFAASRALKDRKDLFSLKALLSAPLQGDGARSWVCDIVGARLSQLSPIYWQEILPLLAQPLKGGQVVQKDYEEALKRAVHQAPSEKLVELVLNNLSAEEKAAKQGGVESGSPAAASSPVALIARTWIEKGLVKPVGASRALYDSLLLALVRNFKWSHDAGLDGFLRAQLSSLPSEPILSEVLNGISKDRGVVSRTLSYAHPVYPWSKLATQLVENWASSLASASSKVSDELRTKIAEALASSPEPVVAEKYREVFEQLGGRVPHGPSVQIQAALAAASPQTLELGRRLSGAVKPCGK